MLTLRKLISLFFIIFLFNTLLHAEQIPIPELDVTSTLLVGGEYSVTPLDASYIIDLPFLLKGDTKTHKWLFQTISNLPESVDTEIKSVERIQHRSIAIGYYMQPNEQAHYASLPLILINNDQEETWQRATLPNDIKDGSLHALQCINNHCVAAGYYHTNANQVGTILLSDDTGQNWVKPENQDYPLITFLQCNSDYCLGVHYKLDIYLSKTKGQSWQRITDIQLKPTENDREYRINSLFCSGPICMIGGYSTDYFNDMDRRLLLLISQNNGESWKTISPIKNYDESPSNQIQDVYCDGKHCLIIGRISDVNGSTRGFISISEDGGLHWREVSIPLTNSFLRKISCTGKTCLISGDSNTQEPLLWISYDQGCHWQTALVPILPSSMKSPALYALHCFGKICTASGIVQPSENPLKIFIYLPLVLISSDTGHTWQYVPPNQIDGLPTNLTMGGLYSIAGPDGKGMG